MKRFKQARWLPLLLALGAAYPFLVYFGQRRFPPAFFVVAALGLMAARIVIAGRREKPWLWIFAPAMVTLAALLPFRPALAAKTYPVLTSLVVASVFAASVYRPPTVIERFARLRHPDLPPEGVAYTRKVTLVWIAFLVANAGIAGALAVYGTIAQWTLWTGLLSYIAMGVLFFGEWLVRPRRGR